MNDLEDRLREVELAEPPLGFDPDALVERVAKQARLRFAAIAGIVTVGAVVAVVAVFGPAGGPVPLQPAAQTSPPSQAEQSRIRQALATEVTELLPGSRNLFVGTSSADAIGPGRMSATATFVDASGKPGTFQLTVRGREASQDVVPLDRACAAQGDRAGPAVEGLRCDKIPLANGAVLLLTESGYLSGGDPLAQPVYTKLRGLNACLYRRDGTTVTVDDADDGYPGVTDSVQLTEQQLTKVITDPAFTLA